MAFVFPEDKDDFRAPNGVVYKWDGTKWIVKAFRSTDDFLVTLDDDAPDEPKKGDLWFDTKADELTLYLYTGTEWVPASPPVSLDGIEAQINDALIIQDDLLGRVAAGESKQQQIETTIADALAVQGAIQDEQGVQNNQINALETQVQLLAGVRAVGRWTYRRRVESNSPRPPATAAFYGTHKDNIDTILLNWSDINLLMINKTDIDGNIFTFSDFEEGDKVEIIASDGSSACYGTVTNNPSNDVYANMIVAVERSNSGPVEEKEYLISAYRPGSSSPEVDLDILDQRYLTKTGGVMSGPLNFKKGDKETNQFKISPNGGEDYATNIYSFYGQMRFRTSHTNNEGDHVGSHIVLSSNGGSPETKIYHVVESGETGAVPKSYVDGKAGVPVGSIMIWMNSAAPDGWFKLQGSNFDITKYPQLHAYLQNTSGYTSGVLPSWSGHYPGEYGDHLRNDLGSKQGAQTAKPTAGTPRSSNDIPNGTTRGFSPAGSTNAYSAGASKVSISENWDSTTRPKTVVVHYIIKHD